uniref:Methyltransferase type 11 domain-containing protein n=1 Tax=Eucampia antarctica TaxID=49252 RepID=A0A7S2W084_9STRA|mmetsp:Transcript_16073/g.15490  ORF Transcript_16073/g.15490 Transcript_16073/m.15490 type:complete len:359 (+) Transcript_16073:131-1207(+)
MRVYCVGVFGSFPVELLNKLDAIASNGKDVELIVGLLDAHDSENYSWTLDQRAHLLGSLKCVTSVVSPSPSILTESFINDQKIDVVNHMVYQMAPTNLSSHTHNDNVTHNESKSDDSNKQFAVPIDLGIFRTIYYESGVKDPDTLSWDTVWETKGRKNDPSDTRLLTGYDGTDFEPEQFAKRWLGAIKWIEGETVLDVGCGAGFLGDYLPRNGYVGVERSPSLAEIFIRRSNRVVIAQDATSLPFEDGSFDHVISHSMLEYMPGKPAAIQCMQEMQRVARNTVFVGDLRTIQALATPEKYVAPGTFAHTLFQKNDFSNMQELDGFVVSDGWWGGESRFNAMYRKNNILYTNQTIPRNS